MGTTHLVRESAGQRLTEGSDSIWDSADLVSIQVPWTPDCPSGFGELEDVKDGAEGADAGCPGACPAQLASAQARMAGAKEPAARRAAGNVTRPQLPGTRMTTSQISGMRSATNGV